MKKIIGTVRDNATRVFVTPLACLASLEQCRRELQEFVNAEGGSSPPQRYPEDFEFWTFGTFDDESGEIVVDGLPERQFRLSDLLLKS